MKFPNDSTYYEKFKNINDIKYYPYVGQNFKNAQKKIMVFAHNIYSSPEKIKADLERTKSPTSFSDDLYYYTYLHKKWTTAFRNFVKGSLLLNKDYFEDRDLELETTNKIDSFISKISFTNYINDLVESNKANNIDVDPKFINKSNRINSELIALLEPTHIVCWGDPVFNHVLGLASDVENIALKNVGLVPKSGFGYAIITFNGRKIHLLKVHHPSMPNFGHFKSETHSIFNWFYNELG